ncbi:MAG: acyltransferase family protein, partial [Anaerolinea sp.]|nr:acyltransferase family protein [Anaerolinea sp.]
MSSPTTRKIRRHDLDWLRVISVLLLVPFHSALIFALGRQYVVYIKDTVQSDVLLKIAGFIYIWHMPLLFLIAGAATWFALDVRGGRGYVRERVLRLLIPALVAFLTYIPFMTYIHWFGSENPPLFLTHWQGYFTFAGA